MQHIIDEICKLKVDINFIKVLFKNTLKRNLQLIVDNYEFTENIILSIFRNTIINWDKYVEYRRSNPESNVDYTRVNEVYPVPDFVLTADQVNYITNYMVNSLGINREYISRAFFLAGFEHKDPRDIICDLFDWFFLSEEARKIESKDSAGVLEYFMFKPEQAPDNAYLYSILNDWR